MVRFGNVLDHLVQLCQHFKHKSMQEGLLPLRIQSVLGIYDNFEAVQLVIQSVEFAHGGDLFLLDRGSIPIRELANWKDIFSGLKQ